MNLVAVIVPVVVVLARLSDVVDVSAVATSVFVYVVDWLAFRASCARTYVLYDFCDTKLSISVFVYVVD